ncbi:response regulator [Thiohalophilus thiocyanatoxydans]|uniref:Two-component system KDP operon response regulator KdpE n=1 Tax=Thiohalophilus thiocyanatoxydans TaxID=381308 RepID=A0A4V3H4M1_9GAMM|nr:response regulator [Thiohalophilus thiocyanatoxydans]TDY03705.1 two-component system KDP operon response regulator KdpE [Thiohalophilus thiocyanatoxydans]
MSSESAIKILVVEDESQIRKFLRISLEAHNYIVYEARLGEEGLMLVTSLNPDLVILDLGLPDLDGQNFIEQLREWSQIPVLVLSVRASETDKVQALDAGANDYVTKPFGIGELMARVRAILRSSDDSSNSATVFESQGLHVDFTTREVTVDGTAVHLSKKEYTLLRLLVSSHGQVLTHQQIIREIWDSTHQDDVHYLRVLVGQLRQKLGDNPAQPRFIMTVQGVGYRFSIL